MHQFVICVQHFTHAFYQPGLNTWLLRMRYAHQQFKLLPPHTYGTVVLTSVNILRLNLNIPISSRFSVANTIIRLIHRYICVSWRRLKTQLCLGCVDEFIPLLWMSVLRCSLCDNMKHCSCVRNIYVKTCRFFKYCCKICAMEL